jgi:hypothetical protein
MLTRLVIDEEMHRRMGHAAREATALYAIERTSHLLVDQYQRLVDTKRQRRRSWALRARGLLDRFRG